MSDCGGRDGDCSNTQIDDSFTYRRVALHAPKYRRHDADAFVERIGIDVNEFRAARTKIQLLIRGWLFPGCLCDRNESRWAIFFQA